MFRYLQLGIIPLTGHLPCSGDRTFQQFLVIGPLARYADDLHLAMKILSSKCERPLNLSATVDLRKLRVFYLDSIGGMCGITKASSELRQSVHKVIHYISERGAHVEQLPQDWIRHVHNMIISLFGELDTPYVLNVDNPEHKKNSALEVVKSWFGLSQHTTTATVIQLVRDAKGLFTPSMIEHYKKCREELSEKMNIKLKDNGILICPTYKYVADYSQLMTFSSDASIYCLLANMMKLPATHVPTGLNKNGLPIGIQVISATYQDHITLAVARELEKAFGGWVPPS